MHKVRQHVAVLTRLVAFLVLAALAPDAEAGRIEIGHTREVVIQLLGEPEVQVRKRNRETLHYGRSTVVLAHGVVVAADPDVESEAEALRAHRPRVSPPRPAPPRPAPRKPDGTGGQDVPRIVVGGGKASGAGTVQTVSRDGDRVDLQDLLVPGNVTIVDFYADWCAPCRRIGPLLENLARSDPEVYLRKVDIVRWGTPVTKQFNIRSVPHVRVFDANGGLVGSGTSNLDLVRQYVQQARR